MGQPGKPVRLLPKSYIQYYIQLILHTIYQILIARDDLAYMSIIVWIYLNTGRIECQVTETVHIILWPMFLGTQIHQFHLLPSGKR